jgi:hypothetical protein
VDHFYDATTRKFRSWAIMCEDCFRMYSRGLGTGLGQKYHLATLEKLGGLQKIVINKCYGGFGLSEAAYSELGLDSQSEAAYRQQNWAEHRDDPRLVEIVEKLGNAANGEDADLAVVCVPDGIEWEIEGYDGREWVSERHRRWYG